MTAACRAILIEEGWSALTHHRVAERSKVARATIYRHWPDTSTLLRDALTSEAVAWTVAESGDPIGNLRAQIHQLRAVLEGDLGRIIAALIDRAEWEPPITAVKADIVEQFATILNEMVQRAIAAGALRDDLNTELAVAQLVGPLFYRRFTSGERTSRAFVDAVFDDFFRTHQG